MGFNAGEFLDSLYRPNGEGQPVGGQVQPSPVVGPDDLPLDWRIAWEERAAVREYDGGLPRDRAEALALADILEQMKRAAEKNSENSLVGT